MGGGEGAPGTPIGTPIRDPLPQDLESGGGLEDRSLWPLGAAGVSFAGPRPASA